MWTVTFRSSTVFPIVCLGPMVMSRRPQDPASKKLMLCFTYTGIATRLRKDIKKNNGYNKPEWLVVWMFLFKSIKSELFHLQVRKWCLRLLLRADVIGHEREVSIRWDERQDTLRLPAPEPHAWVETHVIKKPRILSSTARSVKKAKHWRLGIKDWEEVTPP